MSAATRLLADRAKTGRFVVGVLGQSVEALLGQAAELSGGIAGERRGGTLWNGNGVAPASPPWYDEATTGQPLRRRRAPFGR